MTTRIELSLGNLRFRLACASELRDALLASFEHASYANAPVIIVDRENTAPAWSWLLKLIRTRLDWWECAGVALQHAVCDGNDLARTAAADLLARHHESTALLPWTEALARLWPDARASFGPVHFVEREHEPRLADIVQAQKIWLSRVNVPTREVLLWGHKRGGGPAAASLNDASYLQPLLLRTAQAGRFYETDGPWSWLGDEVFHRSWLPNALIPAVEPITTDERVVSALLDWLLDGWDAWRFAPLLEGWVSRPPSWWSVPARKKPQGWQRPVRPASYFTDAQTMGDIAARMLTKAREQLASPPVLDLAPLP